MSKKELENMKKELELAGVDTEKIPERYDFAEPISKPSACDVYRNNKAFFDRLLQMRKHDGLQETIAENFGANTLVEAEELFEKMNGGLPYKRYTTLRKMFDGFKDCFTI